MSVSRVVHAALPEGPPEFICAMEAQVEVSPAAGMAEAPHQKDLSDTDRAQDHGVPHPAPGVEAQIDLGLMGTIVDQEGHQRRLHVLIATPSSSRSGFKWPTWG
jgi:hypothetical protein